MTQPAQFALGRVPGPEDPRDKEYPFSLALPARASLRTYRYWYPGPLELDQGSEPACVGYTGANWLQSSPTRTKVSHATGLELYRACKAIDGYAGDGTWDRVLMKVLQERGQVKRYLWAQNAVEMDEWLLERGPVLIGIPWLDTMFWPDKDDFLTCTGREVGGHEVLIRGINRSDGFYTITNSWGPGWGRKGDARVWRDDLRALIFNSWGTALTAEEQGK